MTREEAIERVKTMRWEHATNKDNPDHEAMTMAIKALEQEPINDVLDKIRADIVAKVCHFLRLKNMQRVHGLEDAFEIIDKYKVESEDKE